MLFLVKGIQLFNYKKVDIKSVVQNFQDIFKISYK